MSDNKYSVYKHTFPNGKVYIGITSVEPEKRWDNGMGYMANKRMFFDIVQYGWGNIKHEVLKTGLTRSEAEKKEKELIETYGNRVREATYNTQHTKNANSRNGWENLVINKETIELYGKDFGNLNDEWVDEYVVGGMYLDLEATTTGIILSLVPYLDSGIWKSEKILIEYPHDGMTFSEVNSWLFTKPYPVTLCLEEYGTGASSTNTGCIGNSGC